LPPISISTGDDSDCKVTGCQAYFIVEQWLGPERPHSPPKAANRVMMLDLVLQIGHRGAFAL
jgi:hypothetical protein